MKYLWGQFLYILAKATDGFFGLLIGGLSLMVEGVERIRSYFAPLLGCMAFGIISSPFFLFPILSLPRWAWIFILILLFFPMIGRNGVAALNYGRYVLSEYLYDLSNYYKKGTDSKKSFSSYGPRYRRKRWEEEERKRKEAQREQREKWDKIFNDFFSGGGSTGAGFGYYDFSDFGRGHSQNNAGSSGGYEGYRQSQTQSPVGAFKKEYEANCDILGLAYTATEYEVKLAYRKLAKKYHPDINKEAGATRRFQEINKAYEFLSKENIERYKRYA